MSTTWTATRNTSRRTARCSPNTAPNSWCAAASIEAREGKARSRNVVLEFKDYETALACYNSPEYARLVAIRAPHAESDLVIIEGYDGAQP